MELVTWIGNRQWPQCPKAWFLLLLFLSIASTHSDDIFDTPSTTEPLDSEWTSIPAASSTISIPSSTALVPFLSSSPSVPLPPRDDSFVPVVPFAFTSYFYNATISENSPGKTYLVADEKMGVYVTHFDQVQFKIFSGDRDKFFKAEERVVGDFCFLVIRTRTNSIDVLNRERKDKYTIEVRATAKNMKTRQAVEANTTVYINVLDVNDLKPLFLHTFYETVVSEDMPLHKSIIQMHAEDADLGKNGEIYYSFLERTEIFSIHPVTGIVSLTRFLSYHEKSLHDLTVVAQDRGFSARGSSTKMSTAKLHIQVREVNQYSPEIYVHRLPDLVENSSTNIYGIIRVIDKDEGNHGKIQSLDIVDGDPDGNFRIRKIENGEYNLEVLKLVDREAKPQGFNLTLRAVDKGVPQRQTYKSVFVKIADLNDNSPIFDREIYEVSIPETAPINTAVIRLKVTDKDQGANALVFLEIVGGNEGGEFVINPYTGMLYTAVHQDAEEKAFYTLTVSAIDQGNVGTRKQSSAKVKINIIDTNDNDPVFETSEVNVEINENESAGTKVYQVTAKDRDSGENAYISYSIANLNPVPFEIDPFSGVIRTTTVIDYESMRRKYILKVRASDWGLPFRRQSEMQMIIRVQDINDNRPQFEKIHCTGNVPRYLTIGTEILTLSAIDFDDGNIINYRLVSGNEDNCFALDPSSGILSITCDLMDVAVSQRILNATATDGTHFADVISIIINLVTAKKEIDNLIDDVKEKFECKDTGVARRLTEVLASAEKNNMPLQIQEEFAMMPSRYGENVHAPEFINFPSEIKVQESLELGSKITTILARDRDLGYNGKLVFGISSGDKDSVFRIDTDSGELTLVGFLDREREDSYLLNISVYDLGKPQKSFSRILPITVLDENDNAPQFEKSIASFRVAENAVNGTAIFRVNATDADSGDNAKITYTLVTDTTDFAVDPAQGILFVASALDRERQELYELRVRASDGGDNDTGKPPLYSDAMIRIIVDDINDNAPSFALPNYSVKLREDIPAGYVVAVLSASDPDSGNGGDVRYSIVADSDIDDCFTIDKLTGTVRTRKELDFEERQVHSLIIRAKDRGTPSLLSETNLIVEVVDVNENFHAPLFGDFVVSCSVKENLPIGSLVTTVTAIDADPPGDDSRVSYSIQGGDGIGYFSIDDKGVIKTQAILDIETKSHYWLTVYAYDHGVVPLHSRLEVLVAVKNENDNTPLTDAPIYYASVPENSGSGKVIVQLHATDLDVDENQRITYRIGSGNAENLFTINPKTGEIRTTERKLDRENQEEHILEVIVSDNGIPALSSTTRVVVNVTDENDHAPKFEQSVSYKILVPSIEDPSQRHPIFQNASEAEVALDLEPWQTSYEKPVGGTFLLRVLAYDEDIGKNGEVEYSIKSSRGKSKFSIDSKTGIIYVMKPFQSSQEYDLYIQAKDCGLPPLSNVIRLSVSAVGMDPSSPHAPVVRNPQQQVQVTESDEVGYLVALVQASDEDGDRLWYTIVGGDPRNEFFIGRENGNILLAKSLDWETQNVYNLTVNVTDGVHNVTCQVQVLVIDSNDHKPEFSQSVYTVEISENVAVGTEILELQATDEDEDDKVFYSIHASRNPASFEIFALDSLTGAITLAQSLDRETIAEHVLTVMVKDHGTPSKRNYARVVIRVHDHNDHAPEFVSPLIQAKVFETAEIGSVIAKIVAFDRDRDNNAKIAYSILSGNVGNVFSIDPELGYLQVARPLDIGSVSEYMLTVQARDFGNPPQSSKMSVHVMVTMADNAPPRFVKSELAAEIYENQPMGSFVIHVEARATSSLFYELIDGNTDDMFFMYPSTGVILTKNNLDYEMTKFYNLTAQATNMAGAKATCHVIIHVLDRNDNPPAFLQASYSGSVLESALIGALVLTKENTPLVIKATDPDSELNALLDYEIVEALPRRYFHIDSSTGAIRTVKALDHETQPEFVFHVRVSDIGKPRLSSDATARVYISVIDVNDCPPIFSESVYNATILLPTYRGIQVMQTVASDADSPEKTSLRFDIIEGNRGSAFNIDSKSGLITVDNITSISNGFKLQIRVSDGKHSNVAYVNIHVDSSENSSLVFQKPVYTVSIPENSSKIYDVTVVNVLGTVLNEHVEFAILNPTDMFTIGVTSGLLKTTGKKFDRETRDHFELVVEAKSRFSRTKPPRVAHVIVNVTILDVNDNSPIFVDLPYYAVVAVTANKGDVITKVHAIDVDSGENGEVRYELVKGHGELFKVCRKTGEVSLKQSLEGHNTDYELVIAAYDNGIQPWRTEVAVHIKVIDKSMPVFDKQFYSVTVPENIELHSPLDVSIKATSPLNRKLIYSIVKGNDFEEFALDFNTDSTSLSTAPDNNDGPCLMHVVDELDYETKRKYEVTIRATDGVSGVFAEVLVSVFVTDVNDCPPEFPINAYNVSVSEAAPFGTPIVTLEARDNDTGINSLIRYELTKTNDNASIYFHLDTDEGIIYLKRSLDAELIPTHHLAIIARDSGVPSLSSTVHVWITVLDMNDNPPKFEQTSYSVSLSEEASRGQFITLVTASDPDQVDQSRLAYTIVGGNEHQIFTIDPASGVISLMNLQNFGDSMQYILNVSVSDGVYTSFTRVRIDVQPANKHNPVFPQPVMEVKLLENQPKGTFVTAVTATDQDKGIYGPLTYYIASEMLRELFELNQTTGELRTLKELDREKSRVHELLISAVDGGYRLGFLTLRVHVLDDNDHDPVFAMREIRATILSNSPIHFDFVKAVAFDEDEEENAELEYTLVEQNKTLFDIDRRSGVIRLLSSVENHVGEVFQFFVKASDKGSSPRHAHVPITVTIASPDDPVPLFERGDDKFFLSENALVGTIITKRKIVNNITVTYHLLSGNESNPQFSIDAGGQIILARPLDREEADSHFIAVLAETETSPTLSALGYVGLAVLDENDHAPHFESSPYRVSVAENVEEGTFLLKVVAYDEDQGNNREVRYALASETGDVANIFAINPYTGWIKTLVPIDKETIPEYTFQVVATDNGNQKHFSRTSVIVSLKDYNDNPPVFTSRHYQAAVNEDALPGTVVVELRTTDLDEIRTPVDYYVTDGDPNAQFQIRSTGEVFVAKPLDRETIANYHLEITATDSKFIAHTKLTIDVLDANDNPPYCLRHRYRHILSEGVYPGTYILTVLASDRDEQSNTNLRFYLTGEGAEQFSLDKAGGHLKTASPLDREEQQRYQLVAHVQDRDKPKWECSSEIEILISDLNDNPPVFGAEQYSATLPEDAPVGSLVTKMHATDRDIGINRKVKYTFVDSADGHFNIEYNSGIVTLAKSLDREKQGVYNLSVKAADQGTPQLSRLVPLTVHVLDINDNPPEFVFRTYHATVPESESIGTEVIRVLATSKDVGVNAEVSYSIVAGNEHNKFTIHRTTGSITITELLDYERAREYLLTIQAIDGGIPPLSNLATVNITIIDSNDNAPVFSQPSYSTTIPENAEIGDKIIQVSASDIDSGDNGKIKFSIVKGDRQGQFQIDPVTGYLSVNALLDRELISNYVLEVEARDHGVNEQYNSVLINVEISDENDNPPIFAQANYTAFVQEDKAPGHTILKFIVTDADAVPNTSPYTFDFRAGNEDALFKLTQDGTLQTAAKFNHRVKDQYMLQIRVFDNGTPPLFSDTFVIVKIIEESQYPPAVTPLEVTITSYGEDFPGGNIGRVFASDHDQYDTLSYFLTPESSDHKGTRMSDLFAIDRNNGTLRALPYLDIGEYAVNVSVTDGRFVTTNIIKVNVELVSDDMLSNAVVIRFREVKAHDFILRHRKGFIKGVRSALTARAKDVSIISVQSVQGRKRAVRGHVKSEKSNKSKLEKKSAKSGKPRIVRQLHYNNDMLDVLFVVRKTMMTYHSRDAVRLALNNRMDEIEQSTGLVIEEISRERCASNFCAHGVCRDKYVLDVTQATVVTTDTTSFVSPQFAHKVECVCRDGYMGVHCEVALNECAANQCPAGKICNPDASPLGYSCVCPEGFVGPNCEINTARCAKDMCYSPRNPISFTGGSYAQYQIQKGLTKTAFEETMSISLRVRTVQQTGNLVFAAGKIDYSILEIVNGVVQYRFDLGSGEGLVRVNSVFVSDGEWHEIRLDREANTARLVVDAKHVTQGSSPGINEILNTQSDVFYLGAEIHRHPVVIGREDIRKGFIGCMDDVRVARVSVPLHKTGPSSVASLKQFFNVEFNCNVTTMLLPLGACGSQPCQNGGTCINEDNGLSYSCHCSERFAGIDCEVDTNPCASFPCLNGGSCTPGLMTGTYSCLCRGKFSGQRCEYGRYCTPNPCRNGGKCEEGDTGPLCKCNGYSGDICTIDIDECASGPCLHGATCVNSLGSYTCQCQQSYSGPLCATPLYSSPTISSSIYNLTTEEFIGIVVFICGIVILVSCFALYRKFRTKRSRHQGSLINNDTRQKDTLLLNSAVCKPHEVDFKRGSKLSNLEVNQREGTQCPVRPSSYTSSTDPALATLNQPLNNLETLRNYGSAGDELEADLPPDYRRNLNRSTTPHTASDSDSVKPSWAAIPMVSFNENSLKNDLKLGGSKGIAIKLRGSGSEDDQRYHWDCSDWAQQRPLPNITEVPGSEVPDSSSFHSNDSSESNVHQGLLPPVMGPLDPARDIDTLNEEATESEYGLGSNPLDSDGGVTTGSEYRFHGSDSFLRHPNSYLPKYNIVSSGREDTEEDEEDDDDEYVGYGFPRKNEGSALLGSLSNVCEIDDADLNTPELKKLNPRSVIQTAV